jgi:hypothetical protein
MNLVNESEKKLIQFGDKIEKKIEEKGWRAKIDNFFKTKLKRGGNANEEAKQAEPLDGAANAGKPATTPYID